MKVKRIAVTKKYSGKAPAPAPAPAPTPAPTLILVCKAASTRFTMLPEVQEYSRQSKKAKHAVTVMSFTMQHSQDFLRLNYHCKVPFENFL